MRACPTPATLLPIAISCISPHYTLLNLRIDRVLSQGCIFNTNSSGGELALILTQNNWRTLGRTVATFYPSRALRKNYCNEWPESLFRTCVTHSRSSSSHLYLSVKTGRWGAVVTAFVTRSNIKNGFDWGLTRLMARSTSIQPIRLKARLRG
jgi:hypothetical protein